MKFKEFLEESYKAELQVQALIFLMENETLIDSMNESFDEKLMGEAFDKQLKKVGLKLHKSKGIVDYIKSISTGVGKVIFYIIKGDTAKAKKMLQDITKEDVLDFLYKLDLGTLHLVTGPIHAIDAWTGWDLAVNLKSHLDKGEGFSTVLKQAIEKTKDAIIHMFTGNEQKRLLSHVHKIEVVASI